jgi:type IV pilus assembly protein PilM
LKPFPSFASVCATGTGAIRVLAIVMPGPILAEYESAVRAAGYEPGSVLPSSLASLAALESGEPALTANLSNLALTTSVTRGDDLLLYRTVELPMDNAARVAEVQRSIAVASAWFEDHLGRAPHELYYGGAIDPRDFARAVDDPQLSIRELAPVPAIGALSPLGPIGFAAVNGALAGAA